MNPIFHIVGARDPGEDPYAPASLAVEGFVHCSFRESLSETRARYFPGVDTLCVFEIDPHGLDVRVEDTPRGPMPHVYGPIPRSAIRAFMWPASESASLKG